MPFYEYECPACKYYAEVLQKITYMELQLRLPEHLLMRVDKLTMAHAVEARVPFLDHDLVEFAMRLPLSYKLRDGVGKRPVYVARSPYPSRPMVPALLVLAAAASSVDVAAFERPRVLAAAARPAADRRRHFGVVR